jgi:hypothetical protein
MFTLQQNAGRLSIGLLSFFLLGSVSLAQNRPSPEPSLQEVSHQVVVKISQERIDSLKKKLNLQVDQLVAWNVWSSVLLVDVKKQRIEDMKMLENVREPMMETNTTNQKILRQEKRLQFHIDRLQIQFKRIEAARLNTESFYQLLSKDQQTIFDLFWEGQNLGPNSGNWLY